MLYDPEFNEWVFADREGRQLSRRSADQLSPERVMNLNAGIPVSGQWEFRCQSFIPRNRNNENGVGLWWPMVEGNFGVRASFREVNDHDGAAHGRCRGDGK